MGRKAKKKGRKGRQSRSRGLVTPPPPAGPPGWLFGASLVLVLIGLAASLYLGKVHLCAHNFISQCDLSCNINDVWDCGEVARSTYSHWLGVPLALYGIEFFVVCLALVLLPGKGGIKLARWDSLLFCAMLIGLPVCALLGWISVSRLNKACIGCVTVYSVVALQFFVLLASAVVGKEGSAAERISALVTAGPSELPALMRSGAGKAVIAALVLFSTQFFWAPRLLLPPVTAKPPVPPIGDPVKPLPNPYKDYVTDGVAIGPASAKVVIEEFTDFQCPYCAMGHKMMMGIVKRFKGKVRLVHRDFPLDNSCNEALTFKKHAQACRAAIYARCAAAQNKYWPYEALLFPNQELLNEAAFKRFARQVSLDMTQLAACVTDPTTRSAVTEDTREGIRRKIQGTPTYFINGKPLLDEQGKKIEGFPKAEWWIKKIGSMVQ